MKASATALYQPYAVLLPRGALARAARQSRSQTDINRVQLTCRQMQPERGRQ